MDVEIGGRAKALNEGDRTRVGCATLQSRLVDDEQGTRKSRTGR
jgi:hypothetical protein